MSGRIFWHRDLPPADAVPGPEAVVEASSPPVPFHWADRASPWAEARPALEAALEARLIQELDRADAAYAHIVDEHFEEHLDSATQTFTLRGRWRYLFYRSR